MWNVGGTVRKVIKLSKGHEIHCRREASHGGSSVVDSESEQTRGEILTPLVITYRTLGIYMTILSFSFFTCNVENNNTDSSKRCCIK